VFGARKAGKTWLMKIAGGRSKTRMRCKEAHVGYTMEQNYGAVISGQNATDMAYTFRTSRQWFSTGVPRNLWVP